MKIHFLLAVLSALAVGNTGVSPVLADDTGPCARGSAANLERHGGVRTLTA